MFRVDHQLTPDLPPVYHSGGLVTTAPGAGYPARKVAVQRSGGLRLPVRVVQRASVLSVCVAAYRAHRDGGDGLCVVCRRAAPCRPRRNAVKVIEAHADDPRWYDGAHAGLRPVGAVAWARVGSFCH